MASILIHHGVTRYNDWQYNTVYVALKYGTYIITGGIK